MARCFVTTNLTMKVSPSFDTNEAAWKFIDMRIVFLLTLAFGLTWNLEQTSAHDGTGVSIGFLSPQGIVSPDDGMITLTWDDGDAQEEAIHRLFFQEQNIPPTHVPASKHLQGTLLHEVAVTDTKNAYVWDVSNVPIGIYSVYALTTDPKYCRHIEFSLATIVVQEDEASTPTGVIITSPLDANIVGMESATIDVVAASAQQPSLNLMSGTMAEAAEEDFEDAPLCDPFRRIWKDAYPIETAALMQADPDRGAGWWKATIVWPMGDIANDFYAIRAELTIDGKPVATGWSHGFVAAVFGVPEGDNDLREGEDVNSSGSDDLVGGDATGSPVPTPSPGPGGETGNQGGCQSAPVGQLPFYLALLGLIVMTRRKRRI